MKFQVLFFLMLLTCMYLSLAQGSYGNCCLRYTRIRSLAVKHIQEYRMQETDGDCNIRALVLTLKRKDKNGQLQTICTNPEQPKVKKLYDSLSNSNVARV